MSSEWKNKQLRSVVNIKVVSWYSDICVVALLPTSLFIVPRAQIIILISNYLKYEKISSIVHVIIGISMELHYSTHILHRERMVFIRSSSIHAHRRSEEYHHYVTEFEEIFS